MSNPTTSLETSPTSSLADVRQGGIVVLSALGLLLLGLAVFLLSNAATLGASESDASVTWTQGLLSARVWPILLWNVAALAGVGLSIGLLRSHKDADGHVPLARHYNRILIGSAAAFGLLAFLLLLIYGVRASASSFGGLLYAGLTTGTLAFLWAVLSGVSCVFAATWLPQAIEKGPAGLRLSIMAVGGILGLLAVLLGFLLPIIDYREILTKGLEEWRRYPQALIWPGLATLGGLLLMFASLQLGRGLERQNQSVRRLIYGFNAVLTGLLLIAVLTLPNILAYADPFSRFLGRPFDWTRAEVNTISEQLRGVLANLREDVTIYLLMPYEDQFDVSQNTQTLLGYCRSLSPRIKQPKILSPRDPRNRDAISELTKKYSISEPLGMLVIVGDETSKTDHVFVKFDDLYQQDRDPMRPSPRLAYAGENALLNALVSLTEGKMVLYFTQGHGEPSIDEKMPMMGRRSRDTGSLSELRRRLTERRSVEVKSLDLTEVKKVPDDATAVIVVRPTRTFTPQAATVLREYSQRKAVEKDGKEIVPGGKLVLLLEPIIQREGDRPSMLPTGLEGLLAELNVKLGANRVLTASGDDPLRIVCVANPDSPNPIAKSFGGDFELQLFSFQNTRTVDPAATTEKGAGASVEPLFLALPQTGIWAEADLAAQPSALVSALLKDRALANKTLSRRGLSVAVAVSDSDGGVPRDRMHAGVIKETPRAVVFGSANWVSNEGLSGNQANLRADLFSSCLSWLRGKASIGQTIEPKTRPEYNLGVKTSEGILRLQFLPLGLFVLAVVGLGMGVWVVRRR